MYTTHQIVGLEPVQPPSSSLTSGAREGRTRSKLLASVGLQLGLFKDLAAHGASTPRELAARTGLNEKYLSEWLRAMVTARHLDYDISTDRFALPGTMVVTALL